MSAALEACHKWQNENRDLMWTLEGRDRDEALFMAGYRRSLEDAADEWDIATGGYDQATTFLHDRADRVDAEDTDNTTDRT